MSTTREKVVSCPRGGTFKYFLDRENVAPSWRRLAETLGPVSTDERMGTIQIETRALIVRSTRLGNPLTVFRKRACRAEDIDQFHLLVGFASDERARTDGETR